MTSQAGWGSCKQPLLLRPPGAAAGSLYLRSEWCIVPHPEKAHRGGEDACFVSPRTLGVADGVGGWANKGVDAGIFANALMKAARRHSTPEAASEDASPPPPLETLRAAHEHVKALKIAGSSTACILSLEAKPAGAGPQQKLQAANLGDSGLVLVRAGHIIHRSREQCHGFNFPFQLGSQRSTDSAADAGIWEQVHTSFT